jgi:UDP-N-acetylmuramoyl-L-alanyl-D-glutamate--2,6-diaminopimelate ligase
MFKNLLRKIVPESIINVYHKCHAVVACVWYGFPAKKIKVIGITGTNGKTTTAYMIAKIFDEVGNKNAMISTIYYKIGQKMWRNNTKMTTLNPFVLQKFLSEAVKNKCQMAIVEVTSHAVVQSRIWGIEFDTLIFTNITHDHLDYHKTFANYLKAKTKLFGDNKKARAVLNADDKNVGAFKKASSSQIVTYSISGRGMVNAKQIKQYEDMSTFQVSWFGNEIDMVINVAGKFNISNALAAFCTALAYNISPKSIISSIRKIKTIAGRLENIDCGQKYKIIIDFAHTPDGLQKVFESIKPITKGKLIHVGGATGDRDITKRPILGALSGRYTDVSIVTDEDPGSEDREDIINQVSNGVVRGGVGKNKKILGKNFFKIIDRSEAIRFALSNAEKGDIVLITGKGHEKVMKVGDKLIPYSDQEVVKKYFNELQKSNNK